MIKASIVDGMMSKVFNVSNVLWMDSCKANCQRQVTICLQNNSYIAGPMYGKLHVYETLLR